MSKVQVETLDKFEMNLWKYKLECYNEDYSKLVEYYIKDLDVSKNIYIQTIHYGYKSLLRNIEYTLTFMDKESVAEIRKRIKAIHKSNLEYEILKPPTIYKKSKAKEPKVPKVAKNVEIDKDVKDAADCTLKKEDIKQFDLFKLKKV